IIGNGLLLGVTSTSTSNVNSTQTTIYYFSTPISGSRYTGVAGGGITNLPTGGGGQGGGGVGPGDECVGRNSMILTISGLSPIYQLNIGDKIYSANFSNYDYQLDNWKDYQTNDSFFVSEISEITSIRSGSYHYYYNINSKLDITFEHPVFSQRSGTWQYRQTKDLQTGDFILKNNELEQIYSIKRKDEIKEMWNFNVLPYKNYFCNGILTHNPGQYKP
ncbi:MAG: polymorphic toxin-type HINT domain-containing protein, partial [Nanoarchaeota archaeon]